MRKIFIIAILVLVAVSTAGCVQPDNTKKLLEREGYENVTITGFDFFGCSEEDFYHTGFTAEKNGEWVEGVVCAGTFFKGATIRFH